MLFISKWLYSSKGSWVKVLESLLILPIVLPPTVLGFILLIIFSPRTNRSILCECTTFTCSVHFDRCCDSICHCLFPLMYQHTVQGFRGIDTKMINTARTMGASETKIFLKLILPLAKRSILAGIMMSFARALGEFGATLMVAGYIPNKTNTLPLEVLLSGTR
ncbi:ABC transporter permease subunit [Staphylococcus aureus]